jgi:hypothetical protein
MIPSINDLGPRRGCRARRRVLEALVKAIEKQAVERQQQARLRKQPDFWQPGPVRLTLQDISRRVGASKVNTQRSVAWLVKHGFVTAVRAARNMPTWYLLRQDIVPPEPAPRPRLSPDTRQARLKGKLARLLAKRDTILAKLVHRDSMQSDSLKTMQSQRQ